MVCKPFTAAIQILYTLVFKAFQIWNLFVYITKWFPIWITLPLNLAILYLLLLCAYHCSPRKPSHFFFVSLSLSCWFIFSVHSWTHSICGCLPGIHRRLKSEFQKLTAVPRDRQQKATVLGETAIGESFMYQWTNAAHVPSSVTS